MKLRDPGSNLSILGNRLLGARQHVAAKLTFHQGVGDTPDDWYIVYADPQTGYLMSMAYIVTFGKDLAEAEKEPHAITYDGFDNVDGVVISTRWNFWNWSPAEGIHGMPIGDAALSNVRFVEPGERTFARPANARLDALM